jgi:hypothetical protein
MDATGKIYHACPRITLAFKLAKWADLSLGLNAILATTNIELTRKNG